MEILCGEDWEHSEDISTVPHEHWKWFLSAHVGTKTMDNVAGGARRLISNLKVIRDQKGWTHLGLNSWEESLAKFGLTVQQWDWLEAGEPVITKSDTVEQGIQKGKERAAYLEAGQAWLNGEGSQEEVGEKFGVSQPAVSKGAVITENPQYGKQVIIPPHIAANKNSKTDFLRLSPAGQDRVRSGEPLNRVATQEGIRRKLTLLEQAQKIFRKMPREDRDAFDLWRAEQPL